MSEQSLLEPNLDDVPEDDSAEPEDAEVAHEVPDEDLT